MLELLRRAALIGAGALWSATAVSDEAALARLAALEFPRGESIAYIERHSNRLLREPFEQRGWMWIEPDGALVMRVVEPRLEERRLARGELTLRRPSHHEGDDPELAIASSKPRRTRLNPARGAHAELLAISNVLLGQVGALRRRFTVASVAETHAAGSADSWEVTLAPRDARLGRELVSIHLYGSRQRLTALRADRGAKGWQHLQFLSAAADIEASSSG